MRDRTTTVLEGMMRKAVVILSAALLGFGCGDSRSRRQLTIAVIPKGTSHEFWKGVHAGAEQAARELSARGDSVAIIWKGPLREDDREQQIQVVEGFASQGVAGIVLGPPGNPRRERPPGRGGRP